MTFSPYRGLPYKLDPFLGSVFGAASQREPPMFLALRRTRRHVCIVRARDFAGNR